MEKIQGIGRNSADQLLRTFKSVKNIKNLSEDELAKVVGNAKAKQIWNFFHREAGTEMEGSIGDKKEKGPG